MNFCATIIFHIVKNKQKFHFPKKKLNNKCLLRSKLKFFNFIFVFFIIFYFFGIYVYYLIFCHKNCETKYEKK